MKGDRRTFLKSAAALGGVTLTGICARWLASSVDPASTANAADIGYGPIAIRRSANTGESMLALPEGFTYSVIGRAGDPMADGRPTPALHDGMAAFEVDGRIRLVRNHEINPKFGRSAHALGPRHASYDRRGTGGTTTLVVDSETREIERDFLSLSGTLQNCSGGATPWGSWITCEETTLGRKIVRNGLTIEGGFRKRHGYCFEVPAAGEGLADPVPLVEMGRFVHEAIAVDPLTGIVYETEDRETAGLYRFLPNRAGRLDRGGRLQMLAVRDRPRYDTRRGQTIGTQLDVAWVDIPTPNPKAAETDTLAVYRQGLAGGGATFARLEGCSFGAGRVSFTATTGGDRGLGQIWQLEPSGDGGTLRLLYESPNEALLEAPDNLCVTPRGGLVVCEDGGGVIALRGVTPSGEVFTLAENRIPGFEHREFAGATFSPDGRTLFVNAQSPGVTFAIWGPWEDGVL